MSKTITSSTALQPLEWYKEEIRKAYARVIDYGNQYREKWKAYEKATTHLFLTAYEVNKKPSKEGVLRYKQEYKEVGKLMTELGKVYSEYKFNLDLLDSLKGERDKIYGKPRK